MNDFISGAFMFASAAAALFFYQFWRKSRDRLFAILAVAFLLIAVERTVLAFVSVELEGRHLIFVARLVAFVLIILAILDKNRRRPIRGRAPPQVSRPDEAELVASSAGRVG